MAPRLINLVMKLSIIESLIALKIFEILISSNKTITDTITPKKFAKKPLNNPIKISFLFNLISTFLVHPNHHMKSYQSLLELQKQTLFQEPIHQCLHCYLD